MNFLQYAEQLWINNGGNPNDAATAAAIAAAESGQGTQLYGDKTGASDSTATSLGLWQIHFTVHPQFDPNKLLDPNYNAKAAVSLYNAAGGHFGDWSTYNNGAYTHYVDQAYLALPSALSGAGSIMPTGAGTPTPTPTPNGSNTDPVGDWFNHLNPFVPSNWSPALGKVTDPKQLAPLFVGIGVLLIGLVILVANHSDIIERAA